MRLDIVLLFCILALGMWSVFLLSGVQNSCDPTLICKPSDISPNPSDDTKLLLAQTCPRMKKKVAIVLPYHGDSTILIKTVKRWSKTEYLPCLSKNPPKVDLIFSNSLGPTQEEAEFHISTLIEPQARRCFDSIQVIKEDNVVAEYAQGSFSHFNQTFHRLSETHDYFFLMEWDTFAIRPGWMEAVWRHAVCGEDFWMKGGHHRYADNFTVANFGWHINGNALYNSRNDYFKRILADIMSHPTMYIYDVAIERSMSNPDRARITRDFIHMYRLSDFIVNVGRSGWDGSHWRKKSPGTYFVHGRGGHDLDIAAVT
eukprot:TRINITY_DN488_c0_g1_i1.p1 TRINITY_DN488_c0_g1~~TRINITY_DN488_c0_g1_i1.p1  ORF type:complete len:314 (-),score=51.21 TRINITY_DN488_c0_g1_i1:94-1035(-)